MKKSIRTKLSNLWVEISATSLGSWLGGLGYLVGFPFIYFIFDLIWKEQNELNLFGKILITVMLLIISVLYIAGTIALNSKEKEENERYLSIEDHLTYKKFGGWRVGSYEDYVVKASNKYIESIFEYDMNCGISCAIMDFIDDNENINNLYSIKLFYSYIRQHWEKYENREVTVYCFLLPYNGLSMTPFAKNYKFRCNYDKDFLTHLRTTKPTIFQKYLSIYLDLSIDFKPSFHNDEFNIGFRCAEGFNYWKYIEDKNLPIFVKVKGNLAIDQYSNGIIISNCRFEEAYYERYISTLKERKQEWT